MKTFAKASCLNEKEEKWNMADKNNVQTTIKPLVRRSNTNALLRSHSPSLAHAGCVTAVQPCGSPLSNSPLLERERNFRTPKKITFVLNQSTSPAGSVCCL